jgi:hypothetical protein
VYKASLAKTRITDIFMSTQDVSALHAACYGGQLEAARVLLNCGADANKMVMKLSVACSNIVITGLPC